MGRIEILGYDVWLELGILSYGKVYNIGHYRFDDDNGQLYREPESCLSSVLLGYNSVLAYASFNNHKA